MRRGWFFSVSGLFAVLVLWACQPADGSLDIEKPWARETPQGAPNGAVYLTINNKTGAADRLLSVATAVAEHSAVHTHVNEDDIMRMRPRAELVIPAHSTAKLEPGGDHIMLMGLQQQLKAGDVIAVTLTFKHAGERSLTVPVLAMGDMP